MLLNGVGTASALWKKMRWHPYLTLCTQHISERPNPFKEKSRGNLHNREEQNDSLNRRPRVKTSIGLTLQTSSWLQEKRHGCNVSGRIRKDICSIYELQNIYKNMCDCLMWKKRQPPHINKDLGTLACVCPARSVDGHPFGKWNGLPWGDRSHARRTTGSSASRRFLLHLQGHVKSLTVTWFTKPGAAQMTGLVVQWKVTQD